MSARYRVATALHRLARRIDASADNTNTAEPMNYTIVHSGLDLAEAQRIARKMQVARVIVTDPKTGKVITGAAGGGGGAGGSATFGPIRYQ